MKKFILLCGLVLFTLLFLGLEEEVTIEFSEAELDWMSKNPVIRLAPDINFGPIEYLSDDGKVKGAAVDYLSWIESHTGLEIEFVIYYGWPKVLEEIKEKNVEMLGAATKTEQRQEYLIFTDPYISVPNVIITREDGPSNLVLDDLAGLEVVVLKDYAIQDYLEYNYDQINLVPVETLDEGLSLVSFGTKDYMVVSLAQVSYYIKEKAVTNLKISGETGYNNELSFAIRDDWSMLRRILNKALRAMPSEEKERIYDKWIRIEVDQLISRKLAYGIVTILAVVLLALVLIIFFNHILRIQVDERTELYRHELHDRIKAEEDLAKLNDTLEDKVRIRTEELTQAIEDLKQIQQKFIETEKMASLGRVTMGLSHQLNTPIGTSISLVSFLQKKQNDLHRDLVTGSLSKKGLVTYVEEIGKAVELVEKELNRTKNFIDHFKEVSSNAYPQDIKKINMKTYLNNVVGIYKNRLESQKVSMTLECADELVINTSVVYLNNIFRNLISNSLKHGFADTEFGEIFISVISEDSDIIITYKDNGVGIEKEIINSIYEPLFTTSMGKSPGLGLNILYNTVVTSLGGTLDLRSEYGMGVNFVIRFTQ